MKHKKILAGLAFLTLFIFAAPLGDVQAAVTIVKSDQNAVIKHCKENIKASLAKDVCSAANANKALKTASEASSCASFKDKSKTGGARFRECMVSRAGGYIDDAYNPVPANKNSFNTALTNVLNNVKKGSSSNGGGGSGGSSGPTSEDIEKTDCNAEDGCDLVKKYINPLINVLSVLVGLIAVLSLIIGGIQYSMAGADPQKITKAKNRMFMTIVALVVYFLLYSILQFLIPGGIF